MDYGDRLERLAEAAKKVTVAVESMQVPLATLVAELRELAASEPNSGAGTSSTSPLDGGVVASVSMGVSSPENGALVSTSTSISSSSNGIHTSEPVSASLIRRSAREKNKNAKRTKTSSKETDDNKEVCEICSI